MPNIITSNDGTLIDVNADQTQWKIFSRGAESVTLTVKYDKNNSDRLVFNAIRVPGTNGTKQVYINRIGSGDIIEKWQVELDRDTEKDGSSITVGCNKTDIAVIFEPSLFGTDDAVVDLSAIVNEKSFA
jgi:hypothetical protein